MLVKPKGATTHMFSFTSSLKTSLLRVSVAIPLLLSLSVPVHAQDYPVVQMTKRNAPAFAIDGNPGGDYRQDVVLRNEDAASADQQWYEIDRGRGYFSFQKVGTNFCLDGNNNGGDGQNVFLWECQDSNQNQHWLKVNVGGDYYRLEKRNAAGYSLDGNRGGANGQSVYLWSSNNANQNQHWIFEFVSENNGGGSGGSVSSDGATFVGGGGTVAGARSHSCATPSGFTRVNSLSDMISAMDQSNVKVALAPGSYSVDEGDTDLFATQTLPWGKTVSALMSVNGNNSQYDFRCATIDFDTDLWREFDRNEVVQLHFMGNNNVVSNLTIEDIGDTSPRGGALNAVMDGRDNTIEGAIITSRGSQPYGLGDAYGKGGGSVLSHQKHSTVLIRGLRNTLRQSTVFNYSYGHSVFMQGSEDTLIDGVYVQGELRSTADMLTANNPRFAAADARAASVDFTTVWGYRLPTGYWMSLQEAGIRAYNGGNTIIDGVAYQRGADTVTVLNSVVRNTRTGVTLNHATGTKYIENTTVIGTETGFSIGSGNIVASYGDADVGPIISFAYSRDRGTTADITVLPTDGSKNGWGAVAFIGGSNHDITLRSDQNNVNQNLKLVVSGDKDSIRHLNGALANQDNLTLRNTEINNLTNFPMVINDLAEGTTGQSNGPVSGNTRENSVRQN